MTRMHPPLSRRLPSPTPVPPSGKLSRRQSVRSKSFAAMEGHHEGHTAQSMPGERQDTTIFFCSCGDGYTYHRRANALADGRWSYTCRDRGCSGRAHSQADGSAMEVSIQHTCVRDPHAVAVARTRRAIIEEALTVPIRLVPETVAQRILE